MSRFRRAMRRWVIALAALLAGATVLVAETDSEQDQPLGADYAVTEYEIPWYTVDCGGEVYAKLLSEGSEYQLNGTAGQPDADAVVGAYELRGGFWPASASPGLIFSDGFESGDCCAWSSGECCPRRSIDEMQFVIDSSETQ